MCGSNDRSTSGNQIVIMDGFSIMVSVVRGAGYFYKQGDRNDITMSKTEDILERVDRQSGVNHG